MVMGWIWTGIVLISLIFSLLTGNVASLSGAVATGAQAGITLAISISGSVCLWTGVGKLMEKAGLTAVLSRILKPLLCRLFPESAKDPVLSGTLSANVCANILGLGNAATPMGIQSALRLKDPAQPKIATDSLCRLVVLNTASIQLIPTNVAALRAGLGCNTPFDILPAVWLTSICSAGAGLACAYFFGKVLRRG